MPYKNGLNSAVKFWADYAKSVSSPNTLRNWETEMNCMETNTKVLLRHLCTLRRLKHRTGFKGLLRERDDIPL
jgi:hypothetical protein